jgi:hypothetical protein
MVEWPNSDPDQDARPARITVAGRPASLANICANRVNLPGRAGLDLTPSVVFMFLTCCQGVNRQIGNPFPYPGASTS